MSNITEIDNFVLALNSFFKMISVDVNIKEVGHKTGLSLRQDSQDKLEILSHLLKTLQDVLSYVSENKVKVEEDLGDTKDISNMEPALPQTSRPKITPEQSSKRKVDQHLVQIKADKSEIDRRISAFIERKQKDVDDTNVREFCGLLRPNSEGNSCARTDAVFIPRSDSKSHVKVTKVENLYGPQTRILNTSHHVDLKVTGMKEEPGGGASARLTGVEERLRNMEEHVQADIESPDVFKRVKALEERILYLESLSPEYFSVGNSKRGKARGDRIVSKRQYKHSQVGETSNIDDKIQLLKAKILAKKVKQDPG